MRSLTSGIATMLCAAAVGAEPEVNFWTWFESNSEQIASFESNREAVFDEIARQLSSVHTDLTFEIGPSVDGRRDFVVSAGGIKSAFPAVESLVASAPKLAEWNVIAFRPRHTPVLDVRYGGVQVDPEDVKYWLGRHEGELAIAVYLPDFARHDITTMKMIGYLFLDQTLGEYDVEMGLGPIDIRALEDVDASLLKSLDQLANEFDQMRQ